MTRDHLAIPPDFRPAFKKLNEEFDLQSIPPKLLDRNLLIATWNIRHLITYHEDESWLDIPRDPPMQSEELRSPERTSRDPFALHFIARIIARFDVVMLTEVRSGAAAVKAVHEILGPNWGVLIQDVSEVRHGIERLVFFFDRRKVTPSGLVCEIVLPGSGHPQFARAPYVAGFECRPSAFTLVALHVKWGTRPEVRRNEAVTIAGRLRDWQRQKDRWAPNLITLGDFQLYDKENRPYEDNPMYGAFTSTGLHIPKPLRNIRNLIFAEPSLSGGLAWFEDALSLEALSAGKFDFADILDEVRFRDFDWSQVSIPEKEEDALRRYVSDEQLMRKAYTLGKYISDKLPLWVEFSIREDKYGAKDG